MNHKTLFFIVLNFDIFICKYESLIARKGKKKSLFGLFLERLVLYKELDLFENQKKKALRVMNLILNYCRRFFNENPYMKLSLNRN